MKFFRFIVVIIAIAWSGSAFSNYSCSGQVTSIAFGPTNGILQVEAGYGVHYLCQFHQTYNGVHPEICKAWYSMFLSAQASGRPVRQHYNPASGVAQSCAELGSWRVPSPIPYYVSLSQ